MIEAFDTRPVAVLPEQGEWLLLRWKEYNGHFITLARTEAQIVNVFARRTRHLKNMPEVEDLLRVRTGAPPQPYYDQMVKGQRAWLRDTFRSWVNEQMRYLLDKGEPLPTGFEACKGREDHYDCPHCKGWEVRSLGDWEEHFQRAGSVWWNLDRRLRSERAFRPFGADQAPLDGEVEYATLGSYGVNFQRLKDAQYFASNGPHVMFFFNRLGDVTLPTLDAYIASYEEEQRIQREALDKRRDKQSAEIDARNLERAKAIAAALEGVKET